MGQLPPIYGRAVDRSTFAPALRDCREERTDVPEDLELEQAVAAVWAIPPPGPDNLLSHRDFVALGEVCARRYGGANLAFALANALRSLGLPCNAAPGEGRPESDIRSFAERLAKGFASVTTRRRHLCPLDLADELSPLSFGAATVRRYDAQALADLFDTVRIRRHYPGQAIDFGRLSELQWLVVEETVAIDPRPEARAVPILFEDLRRDLGAFEPHAARYPPAVERALFYLLLAPWETWSTMLEVDWRGFKIPWVYTVDTDLAIRPPRPPDSDELTFEPAFAKDAWGEDVEYERPSVLTLEDSSRSELASFDEAGWQRLETARTTSLFATPVEHFLVRAFRSDGIDEMMAHMTAIEAAVGEEGDHRRRLRVKPDPNPRLGPTERVAARVAGLIDDSAAAAAYVDLFDLRSMFVHGRASLGTISTDQRVRCRQLSRRVAECLVKAAAPGVDRAAFLAGLLDRGAP
jgi:hypothetical protein